MFNYGLIYNRPAAVEEEEEEVAEIIGGVTFACIEFGDDPLPSLKSPPTPPSLLLLLEDEFEVAAVGMNKLRSETALFLGKLELEEAEEAEEEEIDSPAAIDRR